MNELIWFILRKEPSSVFQTACWCKWSLAYLLWPQFNSRYLLEGVCLDSWLKTQCSKRWLLWTISKWGWGGGGVRVGWESLRSRNLGLFSDWFLKQAATSGCSWGLSILCFSVAFSKENINNWTWRAQGGPSWRLTVCSKISPLLPHRKEGVWASRKPGCPLSGPLTLLRTIKQHQRTVECCS